ncbi:dihydrolipoamide dehydrogenase [Persephonella hydrogeniphila]|uniref:Dihydrolipoyl dehydrogenase n=1 Tax=Persephonella hydrogeniphila TaxID=198703 RepID=A0A285N3W4_9AQUI|nr:dihydrolipoyl dehydrogenase [Persephonella hydrogeniphila]SNZ04120.1 dihydrolipoamide dehydrogenase [Persephonella hydrogeniphila]
MYDLIIIGTGPGGYEALLNALRLKLNVAVVEKSKLGGNCLNRACIPTKYYRAGSHTIEKLDKLEKYGIQLEVKGISFKEAKKHKDEAIAFFRKSLSQLLKSKKTPVYRGIGKIIDKNKVEIIKEDGTKEIIEGKYILIATGSVPTSVGGIIPDGEYILTTENFIEDLEELPEQLAVIGGGVAGCELGYIASVYGSKVTVIEIKDRLLPISSISTEVSKNLMRKFKKAGIDIRLNVYVKEYSVENGKVKLILSDGNEIVVDKVLLSVGRKPNTENIDEIGIEKDERGFIKVNDYLQTNFENIYACGDVVNSPMLAHVAAYEARVAVGNIFGKEKRKRDYSIVPWAIFTAFEIAHVGLTEEEAKEKGIETVSGYYPYTYNEKAVDELEPEGFVRLVFEKNSKQIIGASIVGIEASEIIHIMAYAIKNKMTAQEVHDFIYFHPSLSEIFIYATYDIVVGKLF